MSYYYQDEWVPLKEKWIELDQDGKSTIIQLSDAKLSNQNTRLQFTVEILLTQDLPHKIVFKAKLMQKNENLNEEKLTISEERPYCLYQEPLQFNIIMTTRKPIDLQKCVVKFKLQHSSVPHSQSLNFPRQNGLENKNNICYMNVILQLLYHLPAFRKLVYEIPNTSPDSFNTIIPYNMQLLFAQMQEINSVPINTEKLRESFGWRPEAAQRQQDAHEFLTLLLDKFSYKFLPHPALLQSFNSLFTITLEEDDMKQNRMSRIEVRSIDLPMESKVSSLKDSLKAFFDQNRQHDYLRHKLISLPSVVTFHIPRLVRESKNTGYFSYPGVINLGKFLPVPEHIDYELVSVVVHSNIHWNVGHYFLYVRVGTYEHKWYMINDSKCREVNEEAVFEKSFGQRASKSINRSASVPPVFVKQAPARDETAYLLTYVRSDKLAEIMEEPPTTCIPSKIRSLLSQSKVARRPPANNTPKYLYFYTEETLRKLLESGKREVGKQVLQKVGFDKTAKKEQIADIIGKQIGANGKTKITLWTIANDKLMPTMPFICNSTPTESPSIDSLSVYDRIFFVEQNEAEENALTTKHVCVIFVQFLAKEKKMQYFGTKAFLSTLPPTTWTSYLKEKTGESDFVLYYSDPNQKNAIKRITNETSVRSICGSSFVFFQANKADELSLFDASQIAGQPLSFFKLSGNSETSALDNIWIMDNQAKELTISDFEHSDKTVKLKIPFTVTFKELESIFAQALGLSFNSEAEQLVVFVGDQKQKFPTPKIIKRDKTVESLSANEDRLYIAIGQFAPPMFPCLVSYSSDGLRTDTYRVISVEEKKEIGYVEECLRKIMPEMAENVMPIVLFSSRKAVYMNKQTELRSDNFVLRFDAVSEPFDPDSIIPRCSIACYQVQNKIASPVGESFFVVLNEADTNESIKEKVLAKLPPEANTYSMILVRNIDFVVVDLPLTTVLQNSAYSIFVINPNLKFDDVPEKNVATLDDTFVILN